MDLLSLPRPQPQTAVFESNDLVFGEEGFKMELRQLKGVRRAKVDSLAEQLVNRYITGQGNPNGKPLGLPPMGLPPRVIPVEELTPELMLNVAYVVSMQTAKDEDPSYQSPVKLIALADALENVWYELVRFCISLNNGLIEPSDSQKKPALNGTDTSESATGSTGPIPTSSAVETTFPAASSSAWMQ